jgi:hypothetical protein
MNDDDDLTAASGPTPEPAPIPPGAPPLPNGPDGESAPATATGTGKKTAPKKEAKPKKEEEAAKEAPKAMPDAAASIFARAIRARAEAAANPAPREVKKPARIRPTMKITGWFRTHPEVFYPGIHVFAPKDEGIDEPLWIWPRTRR